MKCDKILSIVYITICINVRTITSNEPFHHMWATEDKRLKNVLVNSNIPLASQYKIKNRATCAVCCFMRERCMSFFYHHKLKRCVLHEVVFPEKPGNTVLYRTEPGWQYFVVYTAECPFHSGYIQNRAFNSCYRLFSGLESKQFWAAKHHCKEQEASLLRLDNETKQLHFQEYLEYFDDEMMYIQGNYWPETDQWQYDNGDKTVFQIFKSAEPDVKYNDHSITRPALTMLKRSEWISIHDGKHPNAYVCEKLY